MGGSPCTRLPEATRIQHDELRPRQAGRRSRRIDVDECRILVQYARHVVDLFAQETTLMEFVLGNVISFGAAVAEIGEACRLFNGGCLCIPKMELPEISSIRCKKTGIPDQFADVFHVFPRSCDDLLDTSYAHWNIGRVEAHFIATMTGKRTINIPNRPEHLIATRGVMNEE